MKCLQVAYAHFKISNIDFERLELNKDHNKIGIGKGTLLTKLYDDGPHKKFARLENPQKKITAFKLNFLKANYPSIYYTLSSNPKALGTNGKFLTTKEYKSLYLRKKQVQDDNLELSSEISDFYDGEPYEKDISDLEDLESEDHLDHLFLNDNIEEEKTHSEVEISDLETMKCLKPRNEGLFVRNLNKMNEIDSHLGKRGMDVIPLKFPDEKDCESPVPKKNSKSEKYRYQEPTVSSVLKCKKCCLEKSEKNWLEKVCKCSQKQTSMKKL